MAEAVFDFLLEDLSKILSFSTNSGVAYEKDQIESLCEDIEFLGAFVKDSEESYSEHEELRSLMIQIRDLACNALNELDAFVYSVLAEQVDCAGYDDLSLDVRTFGEEIKSFKKKAMGIYKLQLYGIGVPEERAFTCNENVSRASCPRIDDQQVVVGFDYEANLIIERLTNHVQRQLEVIPIVGMAGLGKTTLAGKVYNNPFVSYYFYVRGWTYVSQAYRKKDLLLEILSSVVAIKRNIDPMSEDIKLGEELYKSLKGRRYLIVIDDLWDIGAWQELKVYFPNDSNGSRIMLTTRLRDVALHISPNNPLQSPHFLSVDESWDLLRRKALPDENYDPELVDIGREIAAECHGLPLAVVVVGGILAKNKMALWWKQVAHRVSSNILGEAEQFLDILELSYNHLPHHLKSCFLSFGAFAEDYEIPAWRLICLWIAKGFVQQKGEKRLEDEAEAYLLELIDRNLVIVSTKRSKGGPKVCRIHDMLRDLCLRKAKEKNFLPQADWYIDVLSLLTPIVNYKLIMVLDLRWIFRSDFPNEILLLFHLRYLKLHLYSLDRLTPNISNLWNLQFLIVNLENPRYRVKIPHTVCEMVKLRHLRISGELEFEKPLPDLIHQTALDNLQTLSALPLFHHTVGAEFILGLTSNLRKLEFYGFSDTHETYSVPDLVNLHHLDTLKLTNKSTGGWANISLPGTLPQRLKKLTLSGNTVHWKEFSKLGKLPNLEVLKVKSNLFSGPKWETYEGEFLRLKYLKLAWLDLTHWITSVSHFPRLQHLVVDGCLRLKEIPSCVGDIPTIEMIEILWSSEGAINSARRIQEEQASMGNDGLTVLVNGRGMVRSKSSYDLRALVC